MCIYLIKTRKAFNMTQISLMYFQISWPNHLHKSWLVAKMWETLCNADKIVITTDNIQNILCHKCTQWWSLRRFIHVQIIQLTTIFSLWSWLIINMNNLVKPMVTQHFCPRWLYWHTFTPRDIAPLPPKIMFKLFDSVIKPVLVYGSDVWGHRNAGLESIDKVMLRYYRRILNVKATTSNIIVHGECGMLPPNGQCTISVLSFINRLHHMPANTIVKKVCEELTRLHSIGFTTWVTRVRELVTKYHVGIEKNAIKFSNRVQKCSNRPI